MLIFMGELVFSASSPHSWPLSLSTVCVQFACAREHPAARAYHPARAPAPRPPPSPQSQSLSAAPPPPPPSLPPA